MDQTDQESEMEIDLSLKIDAQEDEKPENGDQNQKVHEDRLDKKYSQDKEGEAEELSLQDENKNTGEVLYLLLSLSLSLYIYINTRISFSFCSFFSCPVCIVFLLQGKNICKGFFLFFFLFSYTIVIWKTLKVKENFIVFVLMEQTN